MLWYVMLNSVILFKDMLLRRRAFLRFLYVIVWWHFSATISQIIMLTSQIFMSSCQNLYVDLSLIHLLENKP